MTFKIWFCFYHPCLYSWRTPVFLLIICSIIYLVENAACHCKVSYKCVVKKLRYEEGGNMGGSMRNIAMLLKVWRWNMWGLFPSYK